MDVECDEFGRLWVVHEDGSQELLEDGAPDQRRSNEPAAGGRVPVVGR